ncbi:MAG: DUF1501 domain-containing protein [Rhodospirillales bacterium]|nr:DUF1501 domain-containing protein [Rhodospirillales bacterium]
MPEYEISRRNFLKGSLCACIAPAFLMGYPGLSFADVPTDKRLVLVFLRGGLDSLSAVVPYADPGYRLVRGKLAVSQKDLLDADGFFAFHNKMKPLHELYQKKELAVIHAVATPYRERSHFDAQDLLENGTAKPNGTDSGWLNRAIQVMGGRSGESALGLSVGPSRQAVLRGDASVTSWSPSYLRDVNEDLISRIARMYEHDELLHRNLGIAQENMGIADTKGKVGRGDRAFIPAMEAAAKFLVRQDGPRIAVVDLGGWDTHVNQNGRLSNLLGILSEGITKFRLKTPDDIWNKTIVYVVSEFGRTVRPNGSNGTDHGTAGMSMVIGGRIQGGRVISQWPGLSENKLFQRRDLMPTTDLRAVSKTLLGVHFGLSPGAIGRDILPGTSGLAPVDLF